MCVCESMILLSDEANFRERKQENLSTWYLQSSSATHQSSHLIHFLSLINTSSYHSLITFFFFLKFGLEHSLIIYGPQGTKH